MESESSSTLVVCTILPSNSPPEMFEHKYSISLGAEVVISQREDNDATLVSLIKSAGDSKSKFAAKACTTCWTISLGAGETFEFATESDEWPQKLQDQVYFNIQLAQTGARIRWEHLQLQETLGHGAYGIVKRAKLPAYEGSVAVKIPATGMSEVDRKKVEEEAILMASINHPHLVKFIGTGFDTSEGHIKQFIVIEFMAGGTLREKIHKHADAIKDKREKLFRLRMEAGPSDKNHFTSHEEKKVFLAESDALVLAETEKDVAAAKERGGATNGKICRDIAAGMSYLHSRSPPLIHRDLRPDNCLIDADGSVKVGDFGKAVTPDAELTIAGALLWMAPEVLGASDKKKDRAGPAYGLSADIYS